MDAAISLGLAVLLVGTVYGVIRAAGAIGTMAVGSTVWRFRALRAVVVAGLLASITGSFAIALFYQPLPSLLGLVGVGGAPLAVEAAVSVAWTTTIIVGGLVATKRALEPALDAAGWREPYFHPAHGLGDRHRRRQLRTEAVYYGLLVALVYALALFLPGAFSLLIPVSILGFVWTLWRVRPNGPVSVAQIREPTDEERARIEACYDRIDAPAPTVVVYDDTDQKTGIAAEGGSRLPTLWLGESLLATLDDESLAVAIAQAERRDDSRVVAHPLAALAVLATTASLLLVAYVESSTTLLLGAVLGSLIAFVLLLGAFRLTRRRIFAIDDAVVDRFGVDAVREAYREAGDRLHLLEDGWHDDHDDTRLAFEPSIPTRIDRLPGGDPEAVDDGAGGRSASIDDAEH